MSDQLTLEQMKSAIADLEQKKSEAVASFPAIVAQRITLVEQKYQEQIAKEKLQIAKEYLQKQKGIEEKYQIGKKLANIAIAAIEIKKLEADHAKK